MINQTRNYNDLIPPSNPAEPTNQLLCYYCSQAIYETTPEAGYRNRLVYMHGWWRHNGAGELQCLKEHLRPDNEIDDPRCGCCKTQTCTHAGHCSRRGKPPYRATPMSIKEDELREVFGWDGKGRDYHTIANTIRQVDAMLDEWNNNPKTHWTADIGVRGLLRQRFPDVSLPAVPDKA